MKSLISLVIVSVMLALGGCSTVMKFDSKPQGAEVVYDGKTLCKPTPCTASVSDRFGWHSVYIFQFNKKGHHSVIKTFQETNPLDHNNILPPVVFIDLGDPFQY